MINMQINDVFEFLNRLYPISTACEFDNVGLLVGDGNAPLNKAIISLDCTLKTVEKARLESCQLIITHHPVIFDPLKRINSGTVVYELIKSGISVISMHTNLDMGDGGVNDSLCKALQLNGIETYTAPDGYVLRHGTISPTTADSLASHIKARLGGCVRFVDGKRKIKTVLVCSGSGGDYVYEALKGGFDALVTADVKHHQFLFAEDCGISLFDAGHFNTEDIVVEPLKQQLCAQFPEITFITDHRSNIDYK